MSVFSRHNTLSLLPLGLLFALSACNDSSKIQSEPPTDIIGGAVASARMVSQTSDLLSGPLARGEMGDYVLENELLRVIVQRPGRRWYSIGSYGGNIIDASARHEDGSFNPDHMEEFVTGVNIENTPNYLDIDIINDGSNGEAAELCASGPDDILDFINASSIIRGFGFTFPDSADDRDLPVEIETCYRLEPGQPYITMETTLSNSSSEDLDIYMVEHLNGSGQVEAFQPQVGFGEPLLTPSCPMDKYVPCANGMCDQCNYLAYTGVDGAFGVSYGMIHDIPGSSSLSTSGINVLVLGAGVLDLVTGGLPNFTVPGNGDLMLTRYFAVGDGSAASIGDIRNELLGYQTGELSGRVTSDGQPLEGAQVAIYQVLNANTVPPSLFMAGHDRTDSDGNYSLTLPAGEYEVRANMEGYLFDPNDPGMVSVMLDGSAQYDFELPAAGMLQVSVEDQSGPVPAKLQLVGFDPSPALENQIITDQAGVFGDVNADSRPYGIAAVSFIDRNGVSDAITVEPGQYQLVLSQGPRYSVHKEIIDILPGQTTSVQARLAQLVETDGFVHSDFHVHSIDSPDSEVTREERVAVYLAEGMDFFTPSDHDIRVDFEPTLEAMEVTDLISTASSGETTTFDYGHFNSWPVTIEPNKLGKGAVDWGRETQPGMDFPEYASYSLAPGEVIAALAADPKDNVVQINHIDSHFGGAGLAIDTGMVPPQSQTPLLERRLDPSIGNGFDDGFDTLEVWIGTNGRGGILNEFLGTNAGDWFNLINQGIVRTGIANSDSHDHRFTRISARNLVASAVSDPGALGARAEILAATVRDGKTVGTNAPFITFEADASLASNPQHAGLRIDEDTTLAVDSAGDVDLTVRVSTPAWAPVDSVEFYINNQPARTTAVDDAARYAVCPNNVISRGDSEWQETEVVVDAAAQGGTRTDITVALTLPAVSADGWVVAVVRGNDNVSEPLFPVLPASLDRASNTTLEDLIDGNLNEGGTPAFAFTNPLFIDVGGDGWTAPGVNSSPSPCGPI